MAGSSQGFLEQDLPVLQIEETIGQVHLGSRVPQATSDSLNTILEQVDRMNDMINLINRESASSETLLHESVFQAFDFILAHCYVKSLHQFNLPK